MSLWTPRNLTSGTLQSWFFLKDATGVKADGYYVTQSGGTASAWADAMGQSANLAQATGANQPAYGASAMGTGRPGLTFTPGQSLYVASGFNCPITSPLNTFFAGHIETTTDAAGPRIVSVCPAGGHDYISPGSWPLLLSGDDASLCHLYFGGNGGVNVDATPSINSIFDDACDSTSVFYGYQNTLATTSSGTPVFGGGGPLDIFGLFAEAGAGGANAAGRCAEVIFTTGVHSSSDLAKLRGYLSWNNNCQANLPGGFAYAGAAPTVPDVYGWRRRMYLRR
jgi:hypothetical protein